MEIVSHIGPCYEKLVKMFIVNMSLDCSIEGSQEYKNVYVKGKCINFHPPLLMLIWEETSQLKLEKFFL